LRAGYQGFLRPPVVAAARAGAHLAARGPPARSARIEPLGRNL